MRCKHKKNYNHWSITGSFKQSQADSTFDKLILDGFDDVQVVINVIVNSPLSQPAQTTPPAVATIPHFLIAIWNRKGPTEFRT
ncbi:hypothetical protein PM082_014674 [Marasmius tenuissimus]|nr:hypothetical protein PM082_014674 [Marasmius tenuissimus]